jgi:hypothetical protein
VDGNVSVESAPIGERHHSMQYLEIATRGRFVKRPAKFDAQRNTRERYV